MSFRERLPWYKPKQKEEAKPEVKSLASFLLDREHSIFLSDMIMREGDAEDIALAQRFADKRPEAGDIEKLAERWQKPFQEKFQAYLGAKNSLTPAFLERFGKMDSTFAQALIGMGGVDKMATVYQEKMLSLAINHPTQFKNIRDALLAYKKHEALRAKTLEAIKIFGFDMNKYDEVVKIDDATVRAAKIKEQVKSKLTGFGKFFNFVTGSWYSHLKGSPLRDAMSKEREIADTIEDVLVGTANENPEIRAAFAHEAMDRKPPMDRVAMSFTDLRDLDLGKALIEAWKKDPRSEQIRGRPEDEVKAIREGFFEEWKKQIVAVYEADGGLWATIAKSRLQDFAPELSHLSERKQENPDRHRPRAVHGAGGAGRAGGARPGARRGGPRRGPRPAPGATP